MRRSSPSPNTIIVARGPGISVRVRDRHLIIEDGFGPTRQTRRFHRTDKLRRLVIIAESGLITLDATRWLHDTGATLHHLDLSGEVIATSAAAGPDLSALRRSQALAAITPAGVELARHVLHAKIEGQRTLLGDLQAGAGDAPRTVMPHRMLDHHLAHIDNAQTIADLLMLEAEAANVFWGAWEQLPLRFGRAGRPIPCHWQSFGSRSSLITDSPRTASNPANAMLNLCYGLLELETILACHALGLDPGIGVFHTDTPNRASMACDLMEAARPAVDRYVLDLIRSRTLNRRDFNETRQGGCRISPRLAAELALTCPHWREQVAPIVEQATHILARHADSPVPLRTPLTRRKWRAGTGLTPPSPPALLPPNTCQRCGVLLTDQANRTFAANRTTANHRRCPNCQAEHHATRAKTTQPTATPDLIATFARQIAPGLQRRTLDELTQATGLSKPYCCVIRQGRTVPHPRHWDTLKALADNE